MSNIVVHIQNSIQTSSEISNRFENYYQFLNKQEIETLNISQIEALKIYQLVDEELTKIRVQNISDIFSCSFTEQIELLLRFQMIETLLQSFKSLVLEFSD